MLAKGQVQPGDMNDLRPGLTPANQQAIWLYTMMNGIDWQALPILVAFYQIGDFEGMVMRLMLIRKHLEGIHADQPGR